MASMQKINDRIERNSIDGESDAFRKFRFQFLQILNPDETPKNDNEFEEMYVNDEEFESALSDFLQIPGNAATCVIGYTGIGKSTCLRHCLSIGVKKHADLIGKQLVWPTFLDGDKQVKDDKVFDIAPRISAVCTRLEKCFPDLEDLLKSDEEKYRFFEFIQNHTDWILENINPIEKLKWDKKETIEKKLQAAYGHCAYEYYANQLKYYISKHYADIDSLVILLDDMESLPDNYQRAAIHAYLKIYECMKNTDYPKDSNYSVKLIISMRPHTSRKYIDHSRKGEAFGVGRSILKRHSVSLKKLFTNRFDYYTKKNPQKIGEQESWDNCRKALDTINDQFDGKYMDMISKLCFYDVRRTLKWYAIILANRFWVQRNAEKTPAFTVNADSFDLNNVNIIRALACKENPAYFDDRDGIVPNIMISSITEDRSILSLMVTLYFDRLTKYDTYGSDDSTVTVKEAIDFWQATCGDDIANKVKDIIHVLFDRRVLRKSIKNIDDYEANDDHTSLDNDSVLYISPRGSELIQMLRNDSVYFEMIREAAWRDYDVTRFNDKTSYELMMSEGKQTDIYTDLLDNIRYLYEDEEEIYSKIKHYQKARQYINIMGSKPVCSILLQGVEKSMIYSGLMNTNPQLKTKFNSIKNRIKDISV